ncbi:MAG TPA: hypothetical protein PK857_11630, partial [Hyphomicrobium sp.]|nr:hypothetical protein [Hyphomicrobium sp.]
MSAGAKRLGTVPFATAFAAAMLLVALASSVSVFAQPTFPTLTGRIVDEAKLLTEVDRYNIETALT